MHRILPCLLCFAVPTVPLSAQDTIRVHVDPRVELMCVVFRLAGNPEYNQAKVPAYADAVDAHFAGFRDHPAVQRARRLRAATGVSFDACMSMAVHLPGIDEVEGAISFSPRPKALDRRWMPADTKLFLREVQDFVEDSEFKGFLASHEELHELTEKRLRQVLDENIRMDWFPEFFGRRPQADFTVIPGLLNGGASYGPRVLHRDGREELFSVLGVWMTDDEGRPRFDPGIVDTVVHEFCHSFCNPVVERHRKELRAAAEKIWPYVADVMRSQAYSNWETMMKETLVRASTTRYVAATRSEKDHARAVAYEEGRGFEWTGRLSELLTRYESQREEHPTLDDFFPEIVDFFDAYADEFVQLEKQRPRIVSMVPANGARDVDPDLEAIVVTFDRPMRDKSWAVVRTGPDFPQISGELRYDEDRKVLTIPVELEPDHDYELWLNRGRYDSFRTVGGVKLRPVRVTFRTRGR